jgi:LPXTG-motif cell wall-anchored protein
MNSVSANLDSHGYGYLISIGVMALIALGMVLFFKRKKWL